MEIHFEIWFGFVIFTFPNTNYGIASNQNRTFKTQR